MSKNPQSRNDAQAALKAACLTAGLVTAFAVSTPAHAQGIMPVAPVTSHMDATNATGSTEIVDGSYVTLNASSDGSNIETNTTSVFSSTSLDPTPMGASDQVDLSTFTDPDSAGIVVLTQTPSAEVGKDFSTVFSGASEENVKSFLFGTSQDFTNTLVTYTFYGDLSQYDLNSADPATAVLFDSSANGESAGVSLGTVAASNFSDAPEGSYGAFGLEGATTPNTPVTPINPSVPSNPAPTPEPSAVASLLLGGLGLAALSLRARRRTAKAD